MDKQYRRGVLCILGATLAWSSAGLIARVAATPPATTLFWRSVFACLFLFVQTALSDRRGFLPSFRRIGWDGLAMVVAWAVSMAAFISALSYMRVANVLVFQAAAPFIAALLAWVALGERPGGVTAAAIGVSMIGVVIMVSGSFGPNDLIGDALSVVMGLAFSVTIVLARGRPLMPLGTVTALAMLLAAGASLPWADLTPGWPAFLLLAAFGIGQQGFGTLLFTWGARRIPAADAGLLSVLETVLGPLWVWLAVDERPDANGLMGGTLVVGAVIVAGIAEQRRRAALA
ncbi:MAG: DMT family transporter [Proteobacteria bacterium]|nr:DMT family transporter [Pseudomonadota bacterium]